MGVHQETATLPDLQRSALQQQICTRLTGKMPGSTGQIKRLRKTVNK